MIHSLYCQRKWSSASKITLMWFSNCKIVSLLCIWVKMFTRNVFIRPKLWQMPVLWNILDFLWCYANRTRDCTSSLVFHISRNERCWDGRFATLVFNFIFLKKNLGSIMWHLNLFSWGNNYNCLAVTEIPNISYWLIDYLPEQHLLA